MDDQLTNKEAFEFLAQRLGVTGLLLLQAIYYVKQRPLTTNEQSVIIEGVVSQGKATLGV